MVQRVGQAASQLKGEMWARAGLTVTQAPEVQAFMAPGCFRASHATHSAGGYGPQTRTSRSYLWACWACQGLEDPKRPKSWWNACCLTCHDVQTSCYTWPAHAGRPLQCMMRNVIISPLSHHLIRLRPSLAFLLLLACGRMLAECSPNIGPHQPDTHLQRVCMADAEHPLGTPGQEEAAVGGYCQCVKLLGALLAGQVPAVERVQVQAQVCPGVHCQLAPFGAHDQEPRDRLAWQVQAPHIPACRARSASLAFLPLLLRTCQLPAYGTSRKIKITASMSILSVHLLYEMPADGRVQALGLMGAMHMPQEQTTSWPCLGHIPGA